MSPRPASSTQLPASDLLRMQMERSIDELAELARSELPPGRFFAEVLRKALQPGGANRVILWRTSLEGDWESAGEMPEADVLDATTIADRQELLNEVATATQPRIMQEANDSDPIRSQAMRVLSPLRHAGEAVGILETAHPLPTDGNLSPATFQFLAALCEITADFLSQQELQQLRRAKVVWQQFDHYQQRLGQSLDVASVCAAIANDGRLVVACDRIAVLVRRGRRYRVMAITGVERPDSRAGGVRSLELLAAKLSTYAGTHWSTSESDGPTDIAREEASERYRRESGTACLGVVPLKLVREQAGREQAGRDQQTREHSATVAPPDIVVVFESFRADERWRELQSRAESLVQRSSFALRAALEQSELPLLGLWQQLRKVPKGLRRPGVLIVLPIIVAIIVALVVVPAEFTVTGHGELWPEQRRDVFATTTGIVDKILVQHGAEVHADQPLIILRDPELEQDIPKIAGEIATTMERLRGVQIARLKGQATPDAAARGRQLTAEEEELKEHLKSLELQRALVEERRQRLTLRSPIAGRVLTWEVDQHLSARPVERGQALLTIGETAGSWVLEIQVADKDAGHMLRARELLGPDLDVEFQLPAEPGRTHRGKIRDVALASESDDRSSGRVRVLVAFESNQIEQLRPGATAVPRIRCGRQPLGYVWLHDLIDAIWIRILF